MIVVSYIAIHQLYPFILLESIILQITIITDLPTKSNKRTLIMSSQFHTPCVLEKSTDEIFNHFYEPQGDASEVGINLVARVFTKNDVVLKGSFSANTQIALIMAWLFCLRRGATPPSEKFFPLSGRLSSVSFSKLARSSIFSSQTQSSSHLVVVAGKVTACSYHLPLCSWGNRLIRCATTLVL